jgi:hypothetical protein
LSNRRGVARDMTPDPNPARAGGAAESGKHHKRLASDVPGFKQAAPTAQDKNRGAPHLRLVPPCPPPRPRRIAVQITARDGPSPYGRTRPFHLTYDELFELIAVVERMDRRA